LEADVEILKAALEDAMTFTNCSKCQSKALAHLDDMTVDSAKMQEMYAYLTSAGGIPSDGYLNKMKKSGSKVGKSAGKMIKKVDKADMSSMTATVAASYAAIVAFFPNAKSTVEDILAYAPEIKNTATSQAEEMASADAEAISSIREIIQQIGSFGKYISTRFGELTIASTSAGSVATTTALATKGSAIVTKAMVI